MSGYREEQVSWRWVIDEATEHPDGTLTDVAMHLEAVEPSIKYGEHRWGGFA